MPLFTDQLGRTIYLDQPTRRIISLVPSQTELLYSLGLHEQVIGITKFCIHPEQWFRTKTRIGGTKDLRLEKIHALQPDLILANKEENDRGQVEELSRFHPVWTSDIATLTDALGMIRSVGDLTGKKQAALDLAQEISRRFDKPHEPFTGGLHTSNGPVPGASRTNPPTTLRPATPRPIRAAYFIWRNPWMVAGGGTFIHDMMERCGLTNIFRNQDRYPSIGLEQLAGSGCELVLLSSEPYPFRDKHITEIKEVLPDTVIRLADGEMFSWYGSRLLLAPDYFRQLLSDL